MKPNLRLPVVLAAILVIVRVPIELQGAPEWASNLVSVVALYLLIFPIVFAVQIARSSSTRPYRDQLRTVALYAFLCRVLLMPIYYISYVQNWTAKRFQYPDGGGIVGAPPMVAIFFPFGQIAIWTLAALVIGGGIGCLIVKIMRRGQVVR